MNGSTAKRLKKIVYGDFSPKEANYTRGLDGSVRCVGRRAAYQKLKRDNHTQSGGSKHIYKGKSRPRWLFPEKRDQ
jgi:hypothetical protein